MNCSWLKILVFPRHVQTYGDKTVKVNPIFFIFGIFTYLADVFSDILLAARYFRQEEKYFFTLTFCFVAVPGLTMSALSTYMYWRQYNPRLVSKKQLVFRAVFLLLCMDPVLRSIEALYYYWKCATSETCIEKKRYGIQMMLEHIHGTYLRTYEAFMECGPQLVLQVYILSRDPTFHLRYITDLLRVFSMSTSLIAMATAIVTYERVEREGDTHLNVLSCSASFMLFIGRFFELVSRVIALSYFASEFPYLIFWIACASHFAIMFLWYRFCGTQYFDKQILNYILNLAIAVIYIFCFINFAGGPSRKNYIFFYTLIFLENTAIMVAWSQCNTLCMNPYLPVMILHYFTFALGIAFMIAFFVYFHPKTSLERKTKKNIAACEINKCESVGNDFGEIKEDSLQDPRNGEEITEANSIAIGKIMDDHTVKKKNSKIEQKMTQVGLWGVWVQQCSKLESVCQ